MEVQVTFSYNGYDVTVRDDGCVSVEGVRRVSQAVAASPVITSGSCVGILSFRHSITGWNSR